ncbi:MAG TPA: VOC family protein [Terracidiphilus sp.]
MNKITPLLWFNANAEDAAGFYLSVFPKSSNLHELRATGAGPGLVGSLIAMDLTLDGLQVTFLNRAPRTG